ncbi:MAG TPA: 2-oxo acid dehydrogenase subunit E2 [Acidimicrobiia bacterium]|jgi:2-oxoglutarate dehydrogenase E2 component (dihydrolipoamide succinyltransferase)|nr:2-oxo acid dehydrogenase subunit E2 [Acidimicrobiia bacterium]
MGIPTRPWRHRRARDTRQFLSPAVRRLAGELGVDAHGLLGRGSQGRVTKDDVIAAGGSQVQPITPARDEVVPFDNIRKRTAAGLLASKRTAAHASAVAFADYRAIDDARRDAHLTALPFVARAVIDALREYPALNGTLDAEDALTLHRDVHLGIAVDLDFKGLVVPVVHHANGLRLRALAEAIRDVARRARDRKLTPDDLAGGTFTITNPGASGTWVSLPIINRPQVAILTTDGVSKQVVADARGRLRVAPMGHLCMSFDHRAVDGAYVGSFLARVKEIVETRDWLTEL